MKVESRIFEILTVFCFVCALVYGLLSKEAVGIVGLTLTGGLCLIVGTYFRFVSRRLEERPEDNPEAEVSDGAGDVGFFSPGSYWPITVAGAVAFTGLGLAFFQWWLIVLAGIGLIIAVCGLVFEYHAGPEAH
ncbi:cytochrome c oxidase subunit 4 [Actinomycetospora endophytica]|uniref:Cytochrome c oxidase polypeptide 4 n=1 Tax=Actinomycetospora endophytica TaxID=2291215 RepID=A0ABS8PHP3_9PSEU|nr:cytochrome c oxidase subunit 4 [Actinomycetospora endophytica]MCD2196509.1 cytochrome c oxidase subunit 4 [Actinomycetospora endophytica]